MSWSPNRLSPDANPNPLLVPAEDATSVFRLFLTSCERPVPGVAAIHLAQRPTEAADLIERLTEAGMTDVWTVCQATINVMPIGEVVTDAGPWTAEEAAHFRRSYERETMTTVEILIGMGLLR